MNRNCNTHQLLKGYNKINKILLSIEAEDLNYSNEKQEVDEVYAELRNIDYKTNYIAFNADESRVDRVPVKHWTEDREFENWYRSMGRAYNDHNKWKYIVCVRNLIQEWINTIKSESNIIYPTWIDNIIFTFKGCKKERKRYLILFNSIINELIDRLDSLDGGYKNNLEQQEAQRMNHSTTHRVGFGH